MGFFRALIQATPHSMPGGFYSSSWQTAKEEGAGYLTNIRFSYNITSLNILNNIANDYDYTDPNHLVNPVYGTSDNSTSPSTHVAGINISNYDKLYLNSNCTNMFYGCRNCTDWSGLSFFDWTYVNSCADMFRNCENFNHLVQISDNVSNCRGMFMGCSNFNQPITISQNVTNCKSMFNSCYNFNQPVTIGQNVVECSDMFSNCIRLKQPIVIPESVNNCINMFAIYSGPTANSWPAINNIVPVPNVYFKGKSFRNIDVRRMFGRMAQINASLQYNNTRGIRVNVHYNKVIENQLVVNNTRSFTGTNLIWTAMGNGRGFYNATANIYLFNDYEG